jgi:hypothetical protein
MRLVATGFGVGNGVSLCRQHQLLVLGLSKKGSPEGCASCAVLSNIWVTGERLFILQRLSSVRRLLLSFLVESMEDQPELDFQSTCRQLRYLLQERLPQVLVGDRTALAVVSSVSRSAPAVSLPDLHPVGDSFDQVLRARSDDNTAPPLLVPFATLQCENGCPDMGAVALLMIDLACRSSALDAHSRGTTLARV